MSHNSCWLRDHAPLTSRAVAYTEDDEWQKSWLNNQKWQQPDALDSGSLTMMGALLSILCGLIAFMECQSNFMPEDHITSERCNIPQLLRRLCLCKIFQIKKSESEDAQNPEERTLDDIRSWELGENKEKKELGENEEKKENCCASKIKAMSDGKFDEFLVYLLINLPFNFMIACYTVVGPSLIASDGSMGIRSDLAGLWQMGSPVAVEMVNLPSTFIIALVISNLAVSFFFNDDLFVGLGI